MSQSLLFYSKPKNTILELTPDEIHTHFFKFESPTQNSLYTIQCNDLDKKDLQIYQDIIPTSEKSPSEIIKLLNQLIQKSEDYINQFQLSPLNYNPKNDSSFNITYDILIKICYIIIKIYEQIKNDNKDYENILRDIILEQAPLPDNLSDIKIFNNSTYLSKLIDDFGSVKIISFCLFPEDYEHNTKSSSGSNSVGASQFGANKMNNAQLQKLNSNLIILFTLFYRCLFPSVLEINMDLNIYSLNKKYANFFNPYELNIKEIKNNSSKLKEFFYANFTLMKCFFQNTIINSKIVLYDSYQIELEDLFSKQFLWEYDDLEDIKKSLISSIQKLGSGEIENVLNTLNSEKKNTKTAPIQMNNNLILLLHLFKNANSDNFFNFTFAFNALDPLLFNTMNRIFFKNNKLCVLDFQFFPKGNQVNMMKILMNSNYYYNHLEDNKEKAAKTNDNINKYLRTVNIPNFHEIDKIILKKDMILKELYDLFNSNLLDFTILLSKRITDLNNLILNFSSFSSTEIDINSYEYFTYSIICFIFNVFNTIQMNSKDLKLSQLEIHFDDINDDSLLIIKKIKKKFPKFKNGFDFSKTKISKFTFSITNISQFFSFYNLPLKKINFLTLRNLSKEDLCELNGFLISKRNNLIAITYLEISLDLMLELPIDLINIFLSNCVVESLEKVVLEIRQNISFDLLTNFLCSIRYTNGVNKINPSLEYELRICNNKLSKNKDTNLFKTVDCQHAKDEIRKTKKLYFSMENITLNSFTINIFYLNKEYLNNFLAIIKVFKIKTRKSKYNYGSDRDGNDGKYNVMEDVYKNIFYMMGRLKKKTSVVIKVI